MKAIIDQYKSLVVQIATPYNKGTGFYLPSYDLIVTNEHVVRDNCDVVIDGFYLKKQIVRVVYLDMKYDLALLSAPVFDQKPKKDFHWSVSNKRMLDEKVIAVGHPFGMDFNAVLGVVTNTEYIQDEVYYYQHDVDLNPGNSGGPLLNINGELIGVNTFIAQPQGNKGFALPTTYLKENLDAFQRVDGKTAARCYNCLHLIFEHQLKHKRYCPDCGSQVQVPVFIAPFEPTGCAKTIENMLEELGHDVKLARRGPNNWGIMQGSAQISILYYEKTGLIIGDASLCNLPPKNIQPLYEYLLRQNYETEGLTFSIKGQDVVLSLLIYDRYLSAATGRKLFRYLFERADYYDNVLVEEYGASWK